MSTSTDGILAYGYDLGGGTPMTTMKIVFECEDTAQNRLSAENLFENIVERGRKDWDHECDPHEDECEECLKPIPIDEINKGKLPITRNLTEAYEMGKVSTEIDVTDMYTEHGGPPS